MKCNSCGKELVDLGIQLTNDEMIDFELAYTKESNARMALKPDIFIKLDLHDVDLYSYIKANTDLLAESIFLQKVALNKLIEKHNLNKKDNVIVYEGKMYLHK